jgi:hypothetical protein
MGLVVSVKQEVLCSFSLLAAIKRRCKVKQSEPFYKKFVGVGVICDGSPACGEKVERRNKKERQKIKVLFCRKPVWQALP